MEWYIKVLLLSIALAVVAYALFGCEAAKGSFNTSKMNVKLTILFPNELDTVLRDDKLLSSDRTSMYTSLAKNEAEGMQFIIRCEESDITVNSVTVSDLKGKSGIISADTVSVYRQHYIHITEPSVGTFPVGFYPDALIPVTDKNMPYTVTAGQNQAFWFTVRTSADTLPGTYTGKVTVITDKGTLTMTASVEVWDITLPDATTLPSAYALWTDMIQNAAGFIDEKTYKAYYDFLLDYRINPTSLPILGSDSVEEYVKKAEECLKDSRIACFNIPFYYNRLPDGTVELQREKNELMVKTLRDKGLLDKGYYYLGGLIDEPSADRFDLVKQVCELLKDIAPDVPHIVTTAPKPALSGYVDTWCPLFNDYNEDAAAKYTANGDKMWWYGCIAPKYPYPTYHTDDRLISKRLVSWMQKDYNIGGMLYWCVDVTMKYDAEAGMYRSRDFWEDPMAFPGAAGDGYLLYVGKANDNVSNYFGPVPTRRLEAIRDGVEDMEYLFILEKKIKERISALGLENDLTSDEVMQSLYSQLYQATDVFENATERLLSMRKLVVEYILTESPALVTVSEPEFVDSAYSGTVTVYAPLNSTVNVDGTNCEAIGTKGNASVYEGKYTADTGTNFFSVVCNGIETRHMIGIMEVTLLSDEGCKNLIEITEESVLKIKAASTGAKHVSYEERNGIPCIKVTYNEAVDYSELALPSSVFSSSDWSDTGMLIFDIEADESNPYGIGFYVCTDTPSAFADDGRVSTLEPGAQSVARIDVMSFGRLKGDLSNVNRVRIGTWGSGIAGAGGDFTFYISNIRVGPVA